ncbi:MAG: TlpA family protein disulfide reductase [candidate division Zixibacteria bacterium]|nr:TlpA family protein disulfide reductase [candidate division Zixibacteria bacterium]
MALICKTKFRLISLLAIILSITIFNANAQRSELGIMGKPAPSWLVDNWTNLPADAESINVSDYQGKVIYLYCFQSWCPGCHKYGFPTLQKLIAAYEDNKNVSFVAVQTTFEGYHTNTFESAKRTAKQYELNIPIGHSGTAGKRSQLMRDYRTGGTPWTVIIDQKGVVQYNDFHIKVAQATDLIDNILEDTTMEQIDLTMPLSRDGRDMIGKKFDISELQFPDTESPLELKGKVSLIRWWTDTCPFCSASLPAIEQLVNQIDDDAFQTLAVYHPKPPRAVETKDILSTARTLGYTGSVAIDINWKVLDKNYLSLADRPATSVSFILDKQGIVRFVHPGPEFQKSDDAGKIQENKDYQDIKSAIEFLLNE